jgi:acrylyl-CoA reductase (NADPH)
MRFQALLVEEIEGRGFTRRVVDRSIADLPAGEVLVKVHYSSLNYKDALSASGNRGVTRAYPHTPGIDAAGVVVSSSVPDFNPGQEVFSVSAELGVSCPGGFGQFIRVPANWLMVVPAGLSLYESMSYGTAGFTAALCVDQLQAAGVRPATGEVLVTGATGGVGIMAVGILAREGYQVTAATGKLEQAGLLEQMGASRVIHREEVNDTSGRPLLSGQWAGVVDTVGGNYLATAIRATRPEGAITACGNAASPDLPLTVFPFILRGVRLIGIDATRTQKEERARLWSKLGQAWKLPNLDLLAREVSLHQLDEEIEKILRGGQTGRVVVNLYRN